MENEYREIRERMAQISRRVGELLYTASQGGNLSCRVGDGMAITPTKRNKRLVTADEISIVNGKGEPIYQKEGVAVTSEFGMHQHIYEVRPDVKAVIHAHPPITTGFGIAHSSILEGAVLPEACMELGPVLSIPYIDPGSKALAVEMGKAIQKTNAVIMQNHGVLVVSSEGLDRAMELLELLEATATSVLVAQLLGSVREISQEDVIRIAKLYQQRGVPAPGKPGVYEDASQAFLNNEVEHEL